jgi:hypothetical protein
MNRSNYPDFQGCYIGYELNVNYCSIEMIEMLDRKDQSMVLSESSVSPLDFINSDKITYITFTCFVCSASSQQEMA